MSFPTFRTPVQKWCRRLSSTSDSTTSKYHLSASIRDSTISEFELKRHQTLLEQFSILKKLDKLDDWYKISFRDLYSVPGLAELVRANYQSSVARTVTTALPEHDWVPWYFRKLPKDYWTSIDNVRLYLDWTGKHAFSIRQLDDWYNITSLQLRQQKGGSSLLRRYNFSRMKLLGEAFPDHPWDPKLFAGGSGTRHWSKPENQRKFFDEAAVDFGIKTRDDWNSITVKQVVQRPGGSRVLELHNRSLKAALDSIYGPSQ